MARLKKVANQRSAADTPRFITRQDTVKKASRGLSTQFGSQGRARERERERERGARCLRHKPTGHKHARKAPPVGGSGAPDLFAGDGLPLMGERQRERDGMEAAAQEPTTNQ